METTAGEDDSALFYMDIFFFPAFALLCSLLFSLLFLSNVPCPDSCSRQEAYHLLLVLYFILTCDEKRKLKKERKLR